MKVTINWTDHRYKTLDFSVVDGLPEVGKRVYNENDGTFSECDNIRDITDMSARSDWGDGGYYSLYEVRYITGETENGKDIEADSYEYKHIAIWNSYEDPAPKYRVVLEHWIIPYAADPDKDDFFEIANDNPNGMDSDEEIAIFDTEEEALAELKKFKCSYEKWENYHQTTFDLYAVEEIVYDEDGEINEYNFIKYAEIED